MEPAFNEVILASATILTVASTRLSTQTICIILNFNGPPWAYVNVIESNGSTHSASSSKQADHMPEPIKADKPPSLYKRFSCPPTGVFSLLNDCHSELTSIKCSPTSNLPYGQRYRQLDCLEWSSGCYAYCSICNFLLLKHRIRILAVLSSLKGGTILLCCRSDNIFLSYVGFVAFGASYASTIPSLRLSYGCLLDTIAEAQTLIR
ncbi:hypothetical protein GQX74_011759 [Glossina fuscipes]|nr:hypothetical protein GQX74_011759 [Glossina fuscipes]